MKKVLVIEDDKMITKLYQDHFAQKYETYFTAYGDTGITQAIMWQPDVIVLDLVLVGTMNGMQVLKDLKANPSTQHIPVVVATNLQSQKENILEAGACNFIIKSETLLEDLVKTVENCIALKSK